MKATMYGIEIEGTPMEIAELKLRIETCLNIQARVTNPAPLKAPPWWVKSETTTTTDSTGKKQSTLVENKQLLAFYCGVHG